MTKTAGFSKLK